MVTRFSNATEHDDFRWRDRAACRNLEPDVFFPIGVTGVAIEEIRAAKAVCAGCAVRVECLRFALATNQDAGVWGGASEDERRRMRSARTSAHRRGLVTR